MLIVENTVSVYQLGKNITFWDITLCFHKLFYVYKSKSILLNHLKNWGFQLGREWRIIPKNQREVKISTEQLLHLRIRENCWRGVRKIVRASKFAAISYLLGMLRHTPINSHQHDFQKMTGTRTTARDKSKWTGESPKASTLHKELHSTANRGETVFPREKHINWSSNTKWAILKTYVHVTIKRLSMLYLRI